MEAVLVVARHPHVPTTGPCGVEQAQELGPEPARSGGLPHASDAIGGGGVAETQQQRCGAERRWLDLGEVWPAHDAPHTGVTRVASCADCAGMYAYDIFCRYDMPVGILQIIKEAHKVFSTPCRS